MPDITRDEVAHLADLARIDLSDAELDHLAPQLAVILESDRLDQRGGRRRRPADVARAAADQRLPRGRRPARAHRRGGAVRRPGRRAAAVQRAADPGGGGMSDLTRRTAAELADALAAGETTLGRADPGPPGPDRRGRRRRARLPARRRRGCAGRGPGLRRAPRRRRAPPPPSTACRSRSRTCWPPRGCPRPAARGSSRAGCRRTTPPWSPGCAPPACRSSARPTWTSSRWAPPPSTPPTARPTTRGTSTGSPAAPAAARPPRSPPSRRRSRSAPTPAARSASPAPSPARSG